MSEEIPTSEAEVTQAAVSDAVVETESPATEGASEEASSTEFDWSGWDGSVDGLPEDHRDIGGKFHTHYESRLNDKNDEISGIKELYDALLMGEEDPRIAKLEAAQKEFDSRYNGLQEEFDGYRTQMETQQKEEAASWASRFEEQHKDLLGDEQNRTRMVDFLDNGWEPESAILLLNMDEEFVEVAEEAKSNGVPDSYAIRLAEVSAGKRQVEKKAKASPRPGARITAGATGAKNPQQAIRAVKDTDNLEDRRMIAARAALKAVKGGRR
jgi:hypothetical protein